MEGFHVALDVEQRCSQFVGDVADESALGCVEFHLAGEVLHGDGNSLEAFAAAIAHRLQHQPQGAAGFFHGAAHFSAVALAAQHRRQGILQLHRQQIGQQAQQFHALQPASLPAEQAPRCGVDQHHLALRIQQQGAIRHGGNQRLLLHLGGLELLDIGFVIGLELGGHGVETVEKFPQLTPHRQGDASGEIPIGHRAHPPQQLLHRARDREGVEHRPKNHQHPDGDEHSNGDVAGEGCTGNARFIGIHPKGHHAQVAIAADQRHKHIGDLPIWGEVLPNQGVFGALAQVFRQLQAATEQQVIAAAVHLADGDAQVDDPLGVGVKDVAEAAAAAPELFGDPGQLPVFPLRRQRRHIAGQQQGKVAGIAGVPHAGFHLDAVEGKEGEPRHHDAHHQRGYGQQLGLQTEFFPPGSERLHQRLAVAGLGGGAGQGGAKASGSLRTTHLVSDIAADVHPLELHLGQTAVGGGKGLVEIVTLGHRR